MTVRGRSADTGCAHCWQRLSLLQRRSVRRRMPTTIRGPPSSSAEPSTPRRPSWWTPKRQLRQRDRSTRHSPSPSIHESGRRCLNAATTDTDTDLAGSERFRPRSSLAGFPWFNSGSRRIERPTSTTTDGTGSWASKSRTNWSKSVGGRRRSRRTHRISRGRRILPAPSTSEFREDSTNPSHKSQPKPTPVPYNSAFRNRFSRHFDKSAAAKESVMKRFSIAVAVVALLVAGCSGGTSAPVTVTKTTTSSAVSTARAPTPTSTSGAPASSGAKTPAATSTSQPAAPGTSAPGTPPPNTDFGGTCEGQEHCPTVPGAPPGDTDFGGTCEGQEHCPNVPAAPPAPAPQHGADFGGTCEGQEHCPAAG
jgi:hypothetical protein